MQLGIQILQLKILPIQLRPGAAKQIFKNKKHENTIKKGSWPKGPRKASTEVKPNP